LVDGLCRQGVVGVGDQLDVDAVGGDVALVEVVRRHGQRRIAVGRRPAGAGLPVAVDGRIRIPSVDVRSRVAAGPVVEAAVVEVVVAEDLVVLPVGGDAVGLVGVVVGRDLAGVEVPLAVDAVAGRDHVHAQVVVGAELVPVEVLGTDVVGGRVGPPRGADGPH